MHDVTLARRLDRNPPLVPITGRGECRNFRINLCTAPGTSSVVKTRTEMVRTRFDDSLSMVLFLKLVEIVAIVWTQDQ